ncbi:hypothetical protein EsDP_00001334 [Epichloe bromicola]|uniref:Uncharacterized protein n=1 Tax=Epichloe bromicola TaxID=79588 RepID=A0ABQ0CHJ7_9HYPO
MATVNFLEPIGRPWRECRPRNDPSRVFELDLDAYGPRDIAGRRHAIKLFAMYVTGISREAFERRLANSIKDIHEWLAKDKVLSISHEAFELVVDLLFWWQFFRSVEEERRPRCPYIPQLQMVNGGVDPPSASYTAWIDQRVDQLPWIRQKRDQQAARTAAAAAATTTTTASSSKKDGSPAPVQEVKNSETSKASEASEAKGKGKGKAIATGLELSRRAASVAPGTSASFGTVGASGEASSSQEASASLTKGAAEGTERYLKAVDLAQEEAKEIVHVSQDILGLIDAQMSGESAAPLFSWKK